MNTPYCEKHETYHDKRGCKDCKIEQLEAKQERVKRCVRYQTTVEIDGKQVKVPCLLLEHVLEALEKQK